MRIVVDTNVLVSAALKDKDPEAVILWIATQSDCEWVVSPDILREYKEVLAREKFGLTQELQQKWFELIDQMTTIVEPDPLIDFPRDQDAVQALAALGQCVDGAGDRGILNDRRRVMRLQARVDSERAGR